MSDANEVTETLIREACDARDYERATTLIVEHYGSELLGFLVAHMRDADAAGEVFQHWSEAFWRGRSPSSRSCRSRSSACARRRLRTAAPT